jgi:long-chain fatty acid transport protein
MATHGSDRWVPRFGIEYTPTTGLALRAGYVFEDTPIPTQTDFTNLVDSDHHVLSVGAGLRIDDLEPAIGGFVQVETHLSVTYLPEREHVKESLVDPVGDYRAGGHVLAGGVTAELVFE